MLVRIEGQVAHGRPGLCTRTACTTPWELVNSVMDEAAPAQAADEAPKTVSVTPAIGASTVAGAISTPRS